MAPREVPGSGILTTEGLPTLFSCESNSYTRIHLIRCSFEYVSPASEASPETGALHRVQWMRGESDLGLRSKSG